MNETSRAVIIVKPGHDTVRLGPLSHQVALDVTAGLTASRCGTAHPEGTTIRIAAYDPSKPHDDLGQLPADPYTLTEAITAEPAGDGTGANFPDLHTRLAAYYGRVTADRLWREACDLADHDAEISQQVTEFHEKTVIAATAAGHAIAAARQLTEQLCDTEMCESADGPDAIRELEAAAAHIRNAGRIAEHRARHGVN